MSTENVFAERIAREYVRLIRDADSVRVVTDGFCKPGDVTARLPADGSERDVTIVCHPSRQPEILEMVRRLKGAQ